MDKPQTMYDFIVVGGGASGVFAAIIHKEHFPDDSVLIIEKTSKLLAKVKISGGGRCNVTHNQSDTKLLTTNYPRGQKELHSPFNQFAVEEIKSWFLQNKVSLKSESDGRIFPSTNSSQTIIDCFLYKLKQYNIQIQYSTKLINFEKCEDYFNLHLDQGENLKCKKLLIAIGGQNKEESYDFLKNKTIQIIAPIPSLFTFNAISSPLKGLEGISTPCRVSITNEKVNVEGIMLITHWGISGPAVIKLSAILARQLHNLNYNFTALLNFSPFSNIEEMVNFLEKLKSELPKQKIKNHKLFELPNRLMERIYNLCNISENMNWADISRREIRNLAKYLFILEIPCHGKTTFKEEFVIAGGINLKEINMKTMECKKIKNLFFAGECTNVDGFTGGFNFQYAWTSAYIVGKQK